ncbi:p53 and DNA damage-regulated protein 1 [Cryptotermes secundus]|uniref:p53 and DNA damage-regulated protein 1 n=1 Tax=Cryptotermes secundus TaxID=105785 RepID=A0A2J7R3R0_9NEOP|nr:p53 and DNA damage-regulated protein 1 [Cryptotermes secundus]
MDYLFKAFKKPFPKLDLKRTSTKEIAKIIKDLKPKNSSGYDEISLKILKISSPYIVAPLNYICNRVILSELGLLENPQHSLEYLEEVERLGEEIVRDKQEVVALDRRRNQNREALRALHRPDHGKTWLTLGSLLIKTPTNKAKELLEHGNMWIEALCLSTDQVQLDMQINKLRSDLKVKVNRLRDMEFQSPVPGLMLSPLTRSELSAVGQVIGRHA